MPRQFQFTLGRLMGCVTATALVLGVVSWLAPETRRALAYFAQVFALLFGMFLTGVLAVAIVQSAMKAMRCVIVRALTTRKRR